MATPIRDWVSAERPRERLKKLGARRLTGAELLAIVLSSGTRANGVSMSAIEVGHDLIKRYGGLHSLSRREPGEIKQVPGIGDARAAQLCAAFELGRRVEAQAEWPSRQVTSPSEVASFYGPMLRDLPREIFMTVHLNTSNIILNEYTISEGGLSASIVEPRAVFRHAILENAASIICLHNHPSGNPEPSKEDIAVTRQLVEAGGIVGIPVHDHIIIAGMEYTSLAERGLMRR
ncbi:MAG: DNA repair protein RadC [Rhodothermales bacterium]|nr:DNA repair protein RadC [Rhodothermales bacterium]